MLATKTETDMGGHRRYGRPQRVDPGEHGFPYEERTGRPPGQYHEEKVSRSISSMVVLAGIVIWSLLAWTAYALVDPVLGWMAANAGLVLDSGKGLATGVGKEAASVAQSINAGGFLGQAAVFLKAVLKPLIIVVWAIGFLGLLAAPRILPKLIGRFARGR